MSTWEELHTNPRLKKIYTDRATIIRLIREYFWSRGFIETETPLAVRYPGQEPYLNPVPVTMHDERSVAHQLHIHTSPEFSMKKLLAAGYEKIFQITKTFRDYESFGGNHNPEFTMIEWYRAPGICADFMDDMENLFKYVADAMNIRVLRYRNKEVPIRGNWDRLTMRDVWKKYIQVELNDYLTVDAIQRLATNRGYSVNTDDEYDDLFFKIFLNEVEPYLGVERPVFVYDYPVQMTSLSRVCEHDTRYAQRVECYVGGLELCNGFGELTDPILQKQQLERDKLLREKLGKESWPVDPNFIQALKSLHDENRPAAGVAMGVDRMVVLCTGATDINEVIFQSMDDQFNQ